MVADGRRHGAQGNGTCISVWSRARGVVRAGDKEKDVQATTSRADRRDKRVQEVPVER